VIKPHRQILAKSVWRQWDGGCILVAGKLRIVTSIRPQFYFHFMDKRDFSERDICTKLISPAIQAAGWAQRLFRGAEPHDPDKLLAKYKTLLAQIAETRVALKIQLQEALTR